MKSRFPQLRRNPEALRAGVTRRARLRAAAAVAASLFCLAGLRSAGGVASAGAPPHGAQGPAAASPQGSPVPPGSTVTTTTATTTTVTTPTPTPAPGGQPRATPTPVAGERVKLYYLREGTAVAAALNAMSQPQNSPTKGLVVSAVGADELVLVGTREQRRIASRIIATLDLPRPGVQMEMWGVQISSRRAEELAEVMRRVSAEIDRTQQAVRKTYDELQNQARGVTHGRLEQSFGDILVNDLYYTTALDPHRPLSISDILLRLIATERPVETTAALANGLDGWLAVTQRDYLHPEGGAGESKCRSKRRELAGPRGPTRRPFERFFNNRGLRHDGRNWVPGGPAAEESAKMGKAALLTFALHYGRLVHDPENFNPYYLQQSAGALNSRLQAAIDALNQDIEDLFVAPTLDRIRRIVAEFCDVEYAQVGKTSVASLSGVPTVVTSKSVNAFETIRPLSLSDFLTGAKDLMDKATPLVPDNTTTNQLGTIPFAEVVGLVGALGQNRSVWRELNSGVSMTITPNVLRNMTSAELAVDLETGDPQASGTQQAGVRPLTRVSQHDVDTKVYVNAMDFFDLSAFASQATLTGGRAYVPIIGPLWRGLFGEAPVIGELLSWKKKPQTVYSQSLVLTTSFITPTAMGVALLVPTDIPDRKAEEQFKERYNKCFKLFQQRVEAYEAGLFGRPARETGDVEEDCKKLFPESPAARR